MELQIVKKFPWVGNLYVSTINGRTSPVPAINTLMPNINNLYAMSEKVSLKDWNVILGHPLDIYVNQFLDLMKIKRSEKTGSLAACEVCRMAKLECSSHSNPLPSALSPFKMIHMDVLQATPISCGNFQYVLVLINDFSCWNRIYLLQKKLEC
jgi:hypothetical protein